MQGFVRAAALVARTLRSQFHLMCNGETAVAHAMIAAVCEEPETLPRSAFEGR